MFTINRQAILGTAKAQTLTASASSFAPGSSGFSSGGTVVNSDYNYSLLDGFIDVNSKDVMYRTFREIYMLDAVSGPAIDQLASLPWSEYAILGVDDKHIFQLYSDCLSELNIVQLMGYISTCYLVLGISISYLVFDNTRGIFSDCILYNPDNCEITPIPMVGYDPKVDLKISPDMKKFLASKDARDIEAKKEISDELLKQLSKGTVPLDPLSTIILNRSSLPGVQTLSYLTRILPIWLVEKALTRGTLLAASRRQRGILHITCLTGDSLIYYNGSLVRLDSFHDYTLCRPSAFPVNFKTQGLDSEVTVNQWIYQGEKYVTYIETSGGHILKATSNHRIPVYRQGFTIVPVNDLRLGDKVFIYDKHVNRLEPIIHIVRNHSKEKVYDISIDTNNGDAPLFVANSILVHNCGDDNWEPTEEQFQSIAQMFANADRDPQGAIVVTRPEINTMEVRSPTDFWMVSNERDQFTQIKLRALGLNDSWGTDSSYAIQENSMTMFLENLRSFRENLTRRVLYNKVFLLLAKYHSFRRRTKAELTHNVRYDINSNHAARDNATMQKATITGSRNLAEAAAYIIPQIKWTKELEPRGDSNALSILSTAKDLGMPIPLSLVCTYAGVPINVLMDSLKQDIDDRKVLKTYNDEIAKLAPKDEDSGDGGMFGSVSNTNPGKMFKLQNTVQRAHDIASIKDSGMLKTYLFKNMPPDVPLTAKQAKQIIQFANSLKPELIR